jgi:hypothetical protein
VNQADRSQAAFTPVPRGALMKKCACGNQSASGGECEECRQKSLTLQRKSQSTESEASAGMPLVNDVINSPGHQLDDSTLGFMESRFGRDFSDVRVHTDAHASESATAVNAQAYTVGRDIVFAPGQYSPATDTGKSLLAHELSHVAQQDSGNSTGALQTRSISSPTDSAEVEADTVAQRVMGDEVVDVTQAPAASMQRALKPGEAVGIGIGAAAGAALLGVGIAALAGAFDKDVFSDDELKAYLTSLATTKGIEGHRDSDNKARDIVNRWSKGSSTYDINNGFKASGASLSAFELKYLLIEEMLSGAVLDDDEQAILRILESLQQAERDKMGDRVGYDKLYDAFDGDELDQLYVLFPQMNSFHPRGKKESKSYTFDQYIAKWEKEHGAVMTEDEKRTLAHGCIGVTALNLFTLQNPDLSNCYDTFAQVWAASRKMNEFLAAHSPGRKALIFSKRFWSAGKDYKPDPKSGKVDMSDYHYETRPGDDYTNFDYGLYDEKTGNWFHANHCDTPFLADPDCHGPMNVYESNLQYYSRGLADFDRQVFCVAIAPHS